MASEAFDEVLAEMQRRYERTPIAHELHGLIERLYAAHDRLAAAHNEELRSAAAEIAERDERIENVARAKYTAIDFYEMEKSRADRAVGLLRELRAARPLLAYGDIWIERIDSFLSEQTKE